MNEEYEETQGKKGHGKREIITKVLLNYFEQPFYGLYLP